MPNKAFKELCLFGYMITLFPYLFYDEEVAGLYSKWEEIGKSLLNEAYQLDADNSIINIIYRNRDLGLAKYAFYKEDVKNTVCDYFTDDTMVERYFKEILVMD